MHFRLYMRIYGTVQKYYMSLVLIKDKVEKCLVCCRFDSLMFG